jgi:site-specific recombinase XerD
MSSLGEHLDRYRSVGFQLEEQGRLLPDFVDYALAKSETTVRTQTAISWAAGSSSDGQRARRLSLVRGFARYLAAFEPETEIPPRALWPAGRLRSARHIYSPQEIARLMQCTSVLAPGSFGATMRTLIGLMAATGLHPRRDLAA